MNKMWAAILLALPSIFLPLQPGNTIPTQQNPLMLLERDSITWYITNPKATGNSVIFNLFADGPVAEGANGMSLIAEASCARNALTIHSARFYLQKGGFSQSDESRTYTNPGKESAFGMARNVVCQQFYP